MKQAVLQGLLVAVLAIIGVVLLRSAALSGHLPLAAIPWLSIATGGLLCAACGILAGRSSGWTPVLLHGVVGVGSLWVNLFSGTSTFFDVWQAMPAPPPEAFTDGAQLVAAVIGGWLPGVLVFLLAFGVVRMIGRSSGVVKDATR